MAVSYTHLDVYKRQPEEISAGGSFLRRDRPQNIEHRTQGCGTGYILQDRRICGVLVYAERIPLAAGNCGRQEEVNMNETPDAVKLCADFGQL